MANPNLDPRPMSASRATMTELMMPHMANNMGNVFGGVVLSLMDRVASVAAIRHAQAQCVTVSMDRVDFKEPIHLGELLTAKANVNYVGRTSLEVGVQVLAENIVTGVTRHTNSSYLTFVAIDDQGRPKPVPPVAPESDDEKRWYEAAKRRRERRIKERRAGGPA